MADDPNIRNGRDNAESPKALEGREDIRQALREIGVEAQSRGRFRVVLQSRGIFLALAAFFIAAICVYAASRLGLIPIPRDQADIVDRFFLGIAICSGWVLLTKLLEESATNYKSVTEFIETCFEGLNNQLIFLNLVVLVKKSDKHEQEN